MERKKKVYAKRHGSTTYVLKSTERRLMMMRTKDWRNICVLMKIQNVSRCEKFEGL